MIAFRIDARSGVPPYLQLVRQVRLALRMGALRPGDQLPTVKEVVSAVAINPNTVSRAYRELEHEGLIAGRAGVGTFVVGKPSGPPPATLARLAQGLRQWLAAARSEGLDDEAIESLLQAALAESSEGIVA